eukprot:gnl/TRDRNA2_/TRDRNA2_84781_c0_seq1.p1 gnl/TRDRNA2_/TRDRNA2_84781_c0~~gnl/TRDRNA2_/TRDRNA2_84781_c0_seq1.p1  ORF type:complete len:539 (-),score=58.32 gnl/TRDRNA2_/TRDRNA2_84781_c0_seq1:93-1589(-)
MVAVSMSTITPGDPFRKGIKDRRVYTILDVMGEYDSNPDLSSAQVKLYSPWQATNSSNGLDLSTDMLFHDFYEAFAWTQIAKIRDNWLTTIHLVSRKRMLALNFSLDLSGNNLDSNTTFIGDPVFSILWPSAKMFGGCSFKEGPRIQAYVGRVHSDGMADVVKVQRDSTPDFPEPFRQAKAEASLTGFQPNATYQAFIYIDFTGDGDLLDNFTVTMYAPTNVIFTELSNPATVCRSMAMCHEPFLSSDPSIVRSLTPHVPDKCINFECPVGWEQELNSTDQNCFSKPCVAWADMTTCCKQLNFSLATFSKQLARIEPKMHLGAIGENGTHLARYGSKITFTQPVISHLRKCLNNEMCRGNIVYLYYSCQNALRLFAASDLLDDEGAVKPSVELGHITRGNTNATQAVNLCVQGCANCGDASLHLLSSLVEHSTHVVVLALNGMLADVASMMELDQYQRLLLIAALVDEEENLLSGAQGDPVGNMDATVDKNVVNIASR